MKFCVCIVVLGIYAINSVLCAPPVIKYERSNFLAYPGSDLVVEAGKQFSLRCEAPTHVNWTSYPEYDAEEGSALTIAGWFNRTTRPGKNYYVANFQVNTSNYLDTGYYYCSTDNAESLDDAENVAKIYIYVKDEDNLLIDIPQVLDTVVQYSTHVIPCRPTSPDVAVFLQINGERIDDGHEREHGDSLQVSFDPTIGYTLKNINLKDSNVYQCRATRSDGQEQSEYVTLHVLPYTTDVPAPLINGTLQSLFGVEGTKVTLECSISITDEVKFGMSWTTPDPNPIKSKNIFEHNALLVGDVSEGSNQMKRVVRLLTIYKATMDDSGSYECKITDHNNNTNSAKKYLKIIGADEKYINLTTASEEITRLSGSEKAQWVIKISAHPAAILSWFSPEGRNLTANRLGFGLGTDVRGSRMLKYEQVTVNENERILRILNVTLSDAGVYQLKAHNQQMEKTLNLTLIVEGPPKITLGEGRDYYAEKKTVNLTCDVYGHPKPVITWIYKPCDNPPKCEAAFKKIEKHPITETVQSKKNSHYRSTLLLQASSSSYIKCFAKNDIGSASQIMPFWVSDVGDSGSEVKVVAPAGPENNDIIAQDNVTLECGFSKYNYTNSLAWTFRPDKVSSARVNLSNTYAQTTPFSYKNSLTINNITEDHSGWFICTANDTNGIPTERKIYVFVQAEEPPTIESENMNNTEQTVKDGSITTLTCNAKGLPKPTIAWYKDNKPLIMVHDNITLYTLLEGNTSLEIRYSLSYIEGQYSCLVSNRAGDVSRSTTLKIEKPPPPSAPKVILGAFLVLVLISVCVIAYLVVKIRKEKKLREELKEIGLEQFDKGAMDNINPDLPIDDQAELLPYDRKWEFPREKLKLGKQLGAGAFGVVMKADAFGICEGEAISMVAVKMVKRNADHTYIKALASELKIMVHLGKHLNVVNLLGACTKNLNKRELLVIVEYCRFGNLHNYLLRHRADFIDQVDPLSGIIDPNFGADIIARHDSMVMKSRMKYAGLSFSRSRSDSESSGCSPTNSGTVNSDAALISMAPTGGEEGCMLSNNSMQPEWRSNYRGDYKGHVRPICTRDVLCWAFQVARGMEYLAGRKVLHGDLAARNILLADDNVVKICDFGLAKSMYKTDNYKKKGDGPLPIKWMAVESISDRVFSTQSDVWSYGIVLWEFFSLAKTPYPGMEADEKLYQKLIGGYRMDKPEYATNAIYTVMKNCWLPKPVDRPTFGDLSETLGSMLEDSVKAHYMDLNDPYMNMNDINWKAGLQSDYLAMMTAPTYDNMVAPGAEGDEEDLHEYVNGGIPTFPLPNCSDQGEGSGYLCMSPALKEAGIFSPRATESNDLFSFSSKPKHSQDETGNPFEKSQLLSNDNNYQSPTRSPTAVNNLNKEPENVNPRGQEQNPNLMPSFSNPSYQTLSAAIAPTTDNYVNMPQHKQAGMDETDGSRFSNYVPMTKPSDGAFNQMAFTKSKDGEGVVSFPNNLSKDSSGLQMLSGENPYVN